MGGGMGMPGSGNGDATLRARRLGIDTYQEPVVYMRSDCDVCRSEGFETRSRVRVTCGERSIIATLNVITSELLHHGEAGLSEAAWRGLGAEDGSALTFAHPRPLTSLSHVQSKIHGNHLERDQIGAIIRDVVAHRYSDVELACFVTACAARTMSRHETVSLTRAMIEAGDRLVWDTPPVMDKHCIGGLPGNRTTLLIVPIVTACGLTMPKTSSRAITSPAGSADAMETLAPVDLSIPEMRRVVEREGGCIVWGGAVRLSPADDILIRVERVLDLDAEAQMIASVLSKKAAAGSTHVVLDIPVGPTAKVRSDAAAEQLAGDLVEVGVAVGLHVTTVLTDGTQPVGRGVGPALEARDVLRVLRGDGDAPMDLRERALLLAGLVLELSGKAVSGEGYGVASKTLDSGRAWTKFQAICEAQGGMREPPEAAHTHPVTAPHGGIVSSIDNRTLARVAKLAGAPDDLEAGVELHTPLDTSVEKGEPLFTIHGGSAGELAYALRFVEEGNGIVRVSRNG